MSLLSAFRFVSAREFGKDLGIHKEVQSLRQKSGTLHFDIYHPPKSARAQIIFIHGMSLRGKEDLRIVRTAAALAHAGFLTFVPEIESIKKLQIGEWQIPEIQAALQSILDFSFQMSAKRGLKKQKKTGLLAPSFSASLSLKAGSQAAAKEHLRAFCLIGGYAEIETTLDFLFCDPRADEYGRLLVLANILGWGIGKGTQVPRAMHLAAFANASAAEEDKAALQAFLGKLPVKEKKMYNQLLSDASYRREVCRSILSDPFVRPKLHKFDLMPVLAEVAAPVVLIHGADDDVITPEQSRLLAQCLRELGKESHLCISRLLSHGDTAHPFSMIPETWKLLRAFALFFGYLE